MAPTCQAAPLIDPMLNRLLTYLPLYPSLILLLTALALVVIRLARPRFAYFWLVAAFGSAIAWPLVLFERLRLPSTLPLMTWRPVELFPSSPTLLVDPVSWPYALALTTLCLAVILTDVVRSAEADWSAWAACMALISLGLVAVLAGNPLTLMLAWAAIDIVELLILLGQIVQSEVRERIVVAFSVRVIGLMLLVWASVAARASGAELTFTNIPAQVSVYLLLAGGLRLGVLPLHLPFLREVPLRRSLGTLIRLVPAASSLMLLGRAASTGASGPLSELLLALAALAAVYGAAAWAFAENELAGRQYWILGMGALSFGAAIRGQPAASVAWGLALLLCGGLIFLLSTRHRSLLPLAGLGLLGITALPYTPTWQGVRLFAPPIGLAAIFFLLAQALLLAGYLSHSLRGEQPLDAVERWVWLVYPLGLVLNPLALFIAAWWGPLGLARALGIARSFGGAQELPSLASSWPSVAALILVAVLIAWDRIGPRPPAVLGRVLGRIFTFGWLYRFLWWLYRSIRRAVTFINLILEGEGGILWTLLLLTLLLSLIAQQGIGG